MVLALSFIVALELVIDYVLTLTVWDDGQRKWNFILSCGRHEFARARLHATQAQVIAS